MQNILQAYYYESSNHLPDVTKMVFCKMCHHPIEPDDMVRGGVCEFCIDDAQDARDWEETYNELNRWVG